MNGYQDDFDPKPDQFRLDDRTLRAGEDVRDGAVYVFQDAIKLAVRVALATGRPLLLLGDPGTGKSSLAAFVARSMNWNYFEQVVTSRTRAQDLMWSFDAVRRLRDAQAKTLDETEEAYIQPRVLWWAFDPPAARRLAGLRSKEGNDAAVPGTLRSEDHPSVVLIDEIDKADPDVPNDLLVSLGSKRFRVDDLGRDVTAESRTLVFITSNNERSLPAAFLRRCVIHTLDRPDEKLLATIAKNHFPEKAQANSAMFEAVAAKVVAMRSGATDGGQPPPSTAEYLDAVRACLEFGVQPGDSEIWQAISSAVLSKKTESGS